MRSRARLPYKLGFNNGPATISDLNIHLGKHLAAKLVPHHIRIGAGRLLLRRPDVGKFDPLFIESDVISVGDIEKVSCHRRSHRGTRSVPTAWFAPLLHLFESGRAGFTAKCVKQETARRSGPLLSAISEIRHHRAAVPCGPLQHRRACSRHRTISTRSFARPHCGRAD